MKITVFKVSFTCQRGLISPLALLGFATSEQHRIVSVMLQYCSIGYLHHTGPRSSSKAFRTRGTRDSRLRHGACHIYSDAARMGLDIIVMLVISHELK